MRVIRPRTAVVEPERKKCLADSANRALNISVTSTSNGSKSAWVSTARCTHTDLVALSAMSHVWVLPSILSPAQEQSKPVHGIQQLQTIRWAFSQWFPRLTIPQRILNFDMGLEAPGPQFCFLSSGVYAQRNRSSGRAGVTKA